MYTCHGVRELGQIRLGGDNISLLILVCFWFWFINRQSSKEYRADGGDIIAQHYGGQHRRDWNAVTVSAVKHASGTEFQSGIVLTKKEFKHWLQVAGKCLYLCLCLCLIRLSAGNRVPSACTATLPVTILKRNVSLMSRRRSGTFCMPAEVLLF